MNKRLAIVVSLFALLYAFAFGVLFGSHRGVFGDLVHMLDFTLKTKIINSLAIFGYACVALGIWMLAVGKQTTSSFVALMFLAFSLSLAYGFLSPDCTIFNFCDRSTESEKPACTATYDKQGAYAGCE